MSKNPKTMGNTYYTVYTYDAYDTVYAYDTLRNHPLKTSTDSPLHAALGARHTERAETYREGRDIQRRLGTLGVHVRTRRTRHTRRTQSSQAHKRHVWLCVVVHEKNILCA